MTTFTEAEEETTTTRTTTTGEVAEEREDVELEEAEGEEPQHLTPGVEDEELQHQELEEGPLDEELPREGEVEEPLLLDEVDRSSTPTRIRMTSTMVSHGPPLLGELSLTPSVLALGPPPPPRSRSSNNNNGYGNPGGAPQCQCGKSAIERTVTRETQNKDRQFWCCSAPKDEGCGFFVSRLFRSFLGHSSARLITFFASISFQEWVNGPSGGGGGGGGAGAGAAKRPFDGVSRRVSSSCPLELH